MLKYIQRLNRLITANKVTIMDYFNYKNEDLYCENVKIEDLAKEYKTPLYVYSKNTLLRHYKAFDDAFLGHKHRICYAVKANSSLSILNLLASVGSSFDVVSLGEIKKVLSIGVSADRIIFSGVGKSKEEISFALDVGIKCINIESENEFYAIKKIAKEKNKVAPIAFRVNPDVDAKTHPSISTGLKNNKFGISFDKAFDLYVKAKEDPYLSIEGIDCHIGSQMTSIDPILEATDKLIGLYQKLQQAGIVLHHLDIGGGLGVVYNNETPPSPHEYLQAVIKRLDDINVEIFVEPGRAMVANAGVLVGQVEYLKKTESKNFCICDFSMADLIRPALYNAWMTIVPCKKQANIKEELYDVVGPVCESDDFLGKDRTLSVKEGDYIAIRGAGAYGSSMSSNYNLRPICAEVLVNEDKYALIKKRQEIEKIWQDESLVNI